jgi:hypothetical protein
MKKTIVIIFCYNVEDHIPAILKEIKLLKLNKNKDFLFIDDNSTDKTNLIINDYNLQNSKIFFNKKNKGFGLNYKFSILYAIKKKYKKLIFLHGDNQYPVKKIQLIDNELDNASLSYGSRRLNISSMKKNMPTLRLIANIILTGFINFMLKNKSTEYFSGFRGLRVDELKKLNLNKFSNTWIIEQQIHFDFIKKKKIISEIAIPTVYKKSQISKIPPFKYVFSVILNTIKYSII